MARDYLRLLGFSYKKPGKKLIKADADKRKQFAKELEQLEDQHCARSITVYYDEGKIEQEALPRKGWFLKNNRLRSNPVVVRFLSLCFLD